MKDSTVRLRSVELKNIKNVKAGKVEMPGCFKNSTAYCNPEILGLYGQNGSGKTAVIDALYILQQIMTGESLGTELADYIDAKEEYAEITAEFAVFMGSVTYEAGYRVVLHKKTESRVEIERETLSSAKHTPEGRRARAVFMNYDRQEEGTVFTPKKRLEELLEGKKEYRLELLVARKIAEKSNCSYIFGEGSREIFQGGFLNSFHEYSVLITVLFRYALEDLFVIRGSHSGVISANLVLPMAFRIDQDEWAGPGLKGDFAVSLTGPTLLDRGQRGVLQQIVGEINTVLHTIIPGLTVDIRDYGPQLMNSGKEGIRVELRSVRGKIAIPIRMESEGIIKIISILNALIQAFADNSICLAIDELDAGIFEYMLGELLDIFKNNARGQLIFTSHNLRALEMLDKESIMFSTANPKNRYLHMKSMKNSNNLRDVYLRCITLGGQKEELYEETDSIKIARAFRKAGRSMRDEEQ